MGTILYEATISSNCIILVIFFIVSYWFVISFPKNIRSFTEKHSIEYNKSDEETQKMVKKMLFGISFFWVLVICSAVDMYIDVVGAYKKGEYEVTEGYVEEFIPIGKDGNNRESFSINGIEFNYSNISIQYGYCKVAKNGGVIYENGQHLKIGYVQCGADGNVIVYIEDLSGIE